MGAMRCRQRLGPTEVRDITCTEIVEDADAVAAGEQGMHQVRPDEAGPPGDEDQLAHALSSP